MKIRGVILLVIASVFWGLAFSVQSMGGKAAGAYTFNGVRMLLAALVMLAMIKIFDAKGLSPHRPATKADWKKLWKFGLLCGFFLCIATNLQQFALNVGAEAGRAGFLTAIYILMVPIVGIFLKKKFGWNLWVGVAIALVGLYFLCINGAFAITLPDLLLILCAVGFTFHICTVDRAYDVDPLRLSAIQFLVCGLLSMIPTILFEILPNPGGFAAWSEIFGSGSFWLMIGYMAVCSCCIGYTLQILGQRDLSPPVASLIMSLESVFSVVFGFLILHEEMTGRQLFGCALILAAVIISQLDFKKKEKVEIV